MSEIKRTRLHEVLIRYLPDGTVIARQKMVTEILVDGKVTDTFIGTSTELDVSALMDVINAAPETLKQEIAIAEPPKDFQWPPWMKLTSDQIKSEVKI